MTGEETSSLVAVLKRDAIVVLLFARFQKLAEVGWARNNKFEVSKCFTQPASPAMMQAATNGGVLADNGTRSARCLFAIETSTRARFPKMAGKRARRHKPSDPEMILQPNIQFTSYSIRRT